MNYRFQHAHWERVARTGFFTGLISYGVFLALDFMRPGFVSRAFSVHLFLAATILFGAWWTLTFHPMGPLRPLGLLRLLLTALFAILAAVLVWNFGEPFGDLRGLFAVLAFLAVIYLVRLLKTL